MTQSSSEPQTETVDFGFRPVAEAEKQGLVRAVFDSVASRYDIMNDVMSLGIHRLWKDALIQKLDPKPGQHLLDVAGGTGDIAERFLKRAGADARVTVCDINFSMMAVGRDRAVDRGRIGGIEWVCGDAERVPLPDGCVDAYTIAFGLRNVTHIDRALAEARRVLKPGGRFLCLEFSRLAVEALRKPYDFYSFQVLPRMGKLIAGDEESYRYLAESIRKFPPQDELVERMRGAGLELVSYRNLTGGIAALHSGWRL